MAQRPSIGQSDDEIIENDGSDWKAANRTTTDQVRHRQSTPPPPGSVQSQAAAIASSPAPVASTAPVTAVPNASAQAQKPVTRSQSPCGSHCKKSFKSQATIISHYLTRLSNDIPYVCVRCGEGFQTYLQFDNHADQCNLPVTVRHEVMPDNSIVLQDRVRNCLPVTVAPGAEEAYDPPANEEAPDSPRYNLYQFTLDWPRDQQAFLWYFASFKRLPYNQVTHYFQHTYGTWHALSVVRRRLEEALSRGMYLPYQAWIQKYGNAQQLWSSYERWAATPKEVRTECARRQKEAQREEARTRNKDKKRAFEQMCQQVDNGAARHEESTGTGSSDVRENNETSTHGQLPANYSTAITHRGERRSGSNIANVPRGVLRYHAAVERHRAGRETQGATIASTPSAQDREIPRAQDTRRDQSYLNPDGGLALDYFGYGNVPVTGIVIENGVRHFDLVRLPGRLGTTFLSRDEYKLQPPPVRSASNRIPADGQTSSAKQAATGREGEQRQKEPAGEEIITLRDPPFTEEVGHQQSERNVFDEYRLIREYTGPVRRIISSNHVSSEEGFHEYSLVELSTRGGLALVPSRRITVGEIGESEAESNPQQPVDSPAQGLERPPHRPQPSNALQNPSRAGRRGLHPLEEDQNSWDEAFAQALQEEEDEAFFREYGNEDPTGLP